MGLIRRGQAVRRLSGITSVSGPIRDRANRVTRSCHLERIARSRDRRIGYIGDSTDHLCPCPSILRWALRRGRDGLSSRRWQDRSVASDDCDPYAIMSPMIQDDGQAGRLGVRDRGRDRPDAAPGTGAGTAQDSLRLGPSAGRRAGGRRLVAGQREASRGCRGRQSAPRLAGTRPAKSAARMAAPAMAIDLALFRWLVSPGPRPLIPSPHAESSTPIAIRPRPHAGRCRRTTAADRTPPCAHPHDTAPPPTCTSRPPPPAGHPLRYRPSWPRTRAHVAALHQPQRREIEPLSRPRLPRLLIRSRP